MYRNLQGVEQTIDYKDSYALEHLTVDFSKAKNQRAVQTAGLDVHRLLTAVCFTIGVN